MAEDGRRLRLPWGCPGPDSAAARTLFVGGRIYPKRAPPPCLRAGTPEQLFQYAKQLAGCRARVRARQMPPDALGACRDRPPTPAAGGAGAVVMPPEQDVFAERPPLGRLGSLLRSAEDACAAALAAGPAARTEAHHQGLPLVTSENLRAMFGDDLVACERALKPLTSDDAWDT